MSRSLAWNMPAAPSFSISSTLSGPSGAMYGWPCASRQSSNSGSPAACCVGVEGGHATGVALGSAACSLVQSVAGIGNILVTHLEPPNFDGLTASTGGDGDRAAALRGGGSCGFEGGGVEDVDPAT